MAPRYLTTANAMADETSNAESPNVAAKTWTNVPSSTLKTDISPAVRPRSILRVTMYSTAGPGVTSSTNAAKRNRGRCVTSIIGRLYGAGCGTAASNPGRAYRGG